MGFLDRLLGRTKQAAGDTTGNTDLQTEGAHQEREGDAADRASGHEAAAREAEHHAARDGETPPT
jgi:uncharacterized protein YjbJ (UPF0337 family)